MKIEQTVLQKTFYVRHKGKMYYIDYLNSDGQSLGLINRDNWEISDEEGRISNLYISRFYEKRKGKGYEKFEDCR